MTYFDCRFYKLNKLSVNAIEIQSAITAKCDAIIKYIPVLQRYVL